MRPLLPGLRALRVRSLRARMRAGMSGLVPLSTPPTMVGVVVALVLTATESALLILLNGMAPAESFGVVFLPGVLVVSTLWGPTLAIATSVLSAVAFDVFRDWPHGVMAPFNLENAVRLAVFVAIALLTNFIAGLARASRHRANDLAGQQSALRRVATLVARGAQPAEVFNAVAVEMARCLHARIALVGRFEAADNTVSFVTAMQTDPHSGKAIDIARRSITLDFDSVAARVMRTGSPARMHGADYDASPHVRELGVQSSVGVPIRVDGRLWGVAVVSSPDPDPMPAGTEARVGDFADLVATGIANAATRAELIASRARIVTAADDARRRFERDLHDGAQQRLVSIALTLRLAEASVGPGSAELKKQLSQAASGLAGVSDDLRQISHGIHPAILSRGGLAPALKTLARRSAVAVTLDASVVCRLPEGTEVAAYYVVAEALTNAAKHAQASQVTVSAHCVDNNLELSVEDDGVGGAVRGRGTGLIGLTDRVEALGGQLRIVSPVGAGTALRAIIPIHQ